MDWLANKSMNENPFFLIFIIYMDQGWICSSVTCLWSSSYLVCCPSNMDSVLRYWPPEILYNILTYMYFLCIMYHDWHILGHITDIIMITLHADQKVAISAMRYEDARKASSSQVVPNWCWNFPQGLSPWSGELNADHGRPVLSEHS